MSGKTATFMSRSTSLSRSISPEPSKCDHPPIMVLLHDKWTAVVPYETWETIVLFLNEVWILHCASKWFKTHFRTYITGRYIFLAPLPHVDKELVPRRAIGKKLPQWFGMGRNSNDAKCIVCDFEEERPESPEESEDDFTYPAPPGGFEEFLTFRMEQWPFGDKMFIKRSRWSCWALRTHVQQCWGYACNNCSKSLCHREELSFYSWSLRRMSVRHL